MTSDVEHIFICLLAIQIFSFVKHLFGSFAHLNWGVCLFFIEFLYKFWLGPLSVICNVTYLSLWLVYSLNDNFLF